MQFGYLDDDVLEDHVRRSPRIPRAADGSFQYCEVYNPGPQGYALGDDDLFKDPTTVPVGFGCVKRRNKYLWKVLVI